MALTLNRKKYRRGKLLLCLLLAALILTQWTATGTCETGVREINDSGNRNVKLSVDPIRKNEGFSAVLYNNTNGLPTSDANAIAQTGEGFLWIGSYAGLIRYDGNTFERIDSGTGIANVRSLYVDSQDRLWIGTNDSGVFLMSKGEFQGWDKDDGLRSVSIRAITEDEEGLIYIGGAAAGIATIDAELNLAVLKDERLDEKTIPDLRRGADGLIYGLTSDGDLFTMKQGRVISFLSHDECRVKGVISLLPDPKHPGIVYLGTEGSQVYYGSLESNFATLGVKEIAPLSAVKCMESINTQIWICATNGIGKLDAEGFHTLRNVPMDNSAEHVITDYNGNLWFASSRQGVMKIVPNQFSDLFERFDLPAAVVNATCMCGERLFIATDTGLIVTEGGKRVDSIPLTKAVTASGKELDTTDLLAFLDGVRIRSVIRDSKGRLWISTWRKYGLIRYDQGEVMMFTSEDGLLSDSVRAVCECEDGSILAANTGGVSVIQEDRVIAGYGEEAGVVNEEILTVTEGFHHEIILGSDGGGIYIIGPEGTKHISTEDGLNSEIILRVKRSSSQNVIWIVTGNSLAFMTPDYQVTTVRQFPYPNNYDLYENSKGDVWVLSSSGIYVVSSKELLANGPVEPVFYGMQSGLPYVASSNSYSELTDDGDLYIASSAGVIKVNIEKSFQNISELKIALPYIDADGVRCYPDRSGRFTLPGNARKVTIYPYVFNYSLIDPQVAWRLEGFDSTAATVSRSKLMPVDYTNLNIGAYTFTITVKDPIGNTEQTVSYPIVKGREMSVGTVGTVIMDSTSLLLLGGLLVYTSLYRKRNQPEDRLFFGMILSDAVLAIGELLSCLLEFSAIPLARGLMNAGNTVFCVALVLFPYLLFVYLEHRSSPDRARVQRTKLLLGIPCFLFLAVMIINLKTGWIFSIGEGNVFHAGHYHELVLIPIGFYYLLALVKVFRIDPRLTAFGILLIVIQLGWEKWSQNISSAAFIYTMVLVCTHLYVMNRPMYEEAP